MNHIKLVGYKINTTLENLDKIEKTVLINTINPHSYCVAKNDEIFRYSLQHSDFLYPDGIGIVIAERLLNGSQIHRIAGADLHKYLLQKTNNTKGKVFYLGSSPSTLKLIEEKVKQEYPNIYVGNYSPPFKSEFSDEENAHFVQAINFFKPDVVFIGMTAPKQEKWAYKHKDVLDTKIIASIGAVFDFYAGTIKRPGVFWQKTGLEWLPRLLREPKRLWKRNFISTPCFLWDVFKAKMGWLKQN